jgi:hypothetical protein
MAFLRKNHCIPTGPQDQYYCGEGSKQPQMTPMEEEKSGQSVSSVDSPLHLQPASPAARIGSIDITTKGAYDHVR